MCELRDSGSALSNGGGSNGGSSSGGSSSGGSPNGGNTGGASGAVCDGGSCAPGPGSLAGTWEIIGSRIGGDQQSALVTLTASSLVVVDWVGVFEAVLHGTAFDASFGHGANSRDFSFSATRTAGPGNAGIIPLPLFGDWDAHALGTTGCTLSVKPDLATADCTRSRELPDWMTTNGTATLRATRTSTLASIFSDFGGTWIFTTALGASCDITVQGSTVSADCANARAATGSATFTLDGDTGHGSTSAGIEFTAQRR